MRHGAWRWIDWKGTAMRTQKEKGRIERDEERDEEGDEQ